MTLALDHIVIAVADLDKAFADYTKLGFKVIRGGEHANGKTANVLVVFEDGAYLELIAWKQPDPGFRWSDVYHRAGEGFLDHALLPDDIAAVVTGAKARGLDISSPEPGGRHRPDGERLEWQTARSPGSDVPFLCGDVTPRRLRVQEGEVRHHANGVTGVAALTIAVKDLDSASIRYGALLGLAPSAVSTGTVGGAAARMASLTLGSGTVVTLASPTAQDGDIAAHLAKRGQGPFSATFAAPGGAGALDAALTHGARLTIAAG